MKAVYAGDPELGGPSIFLAGPTPRNAQTLSWRPSALRILEDLKYEGLVFVPEPKDGHMGKWPSYDDQCEWEQQHLDNASCILFWVPRDMVSMPALTTNVEFGLYARSGKVVLGFPQSAEHMRYMEFCAHKWTIPWFGTLRDTCVHAILRSKLPRYDLLEDLSELVQTVPCALCAVKGGTNIEADGGCRHRKGLTAPEIVSRVKRLATSREEP